MIKFSDHVPEEFMKVPNIQRLFDVLDRVGIEKHYALGEFETVAIPTRLQNIYFLQKYLYQLGQIQHMYGLPYQVYENLIYNAWNIFSGKGSRRSILTFIASMCLGDGEVDFSKLWTKEFLILDDLRLGRLPNGEDLGLAIPNSDGFRYNYLFDTDVTQYYSEVSVAMVSPLFYIEDFRNFIAEIISFYLPMTDTRTCTLKLYMYGHSALGDLPDINSYTYSLNI